MIEHEGGKALAARLTQEPPSARRPRGLGAWNGRHCRSGYRAFAQRGAATGTEELVQFARGQHEQEAFADRLGTAALRAIKLAGGKVAKLL
jgi:hypothetical protein